MLDAHLFPLSEGSRNAQTKSWQVSCKLIQEHYSLLLLQCHFGWKKRVLHRKGDCTLGVLMVQRYKIS